MTQNFHIGCKQPENLWNQKRSMRDAKLQHRIFATICYSVILLLCFCTTQSWQTWLFIINCMISDSLCLWVMSAKNSPSLGLFKALMRCGLIKSSWTMFSSIEILIKTVIVVNILYINLLKRHDAHNMASWCNLFMKELVWMCYVSMLWNDCIFKTNTTWCQLQTPHWKSALMWQWTGV